MKRVTILIPANSTNYLAETLQSISKQTLSKDLFEVLLVLDRVNKETIEEMLSSLDFEVQTMNSSAPGIVNALNEGIKRISTEFIARIDADDIMFPRRLEEQLKVIERRKNLIGLGTSMTLIDELGNIIGQSTYPGRNFFIKRILPYQNVLGHPTMLLRRSALEEVGLYRDTKSEDWDLWIRLSEIGKLANLKKPLTMYRMHNAQLSRNLVSNEAELSSRFQLSRFLRKLGVEHKWCSQSIFESYVTNREVEIQIHKKENNLEKQMLNRKKAQEILYKNTGNRRVSSLNKLIRAFCISPLEVVLLILRRINRFL